ncbi:MAG TPA: hypothetical protein PLF13_09470 [candidate division Zixibacteria bacterium]|nr:hypothetical protein [candidate division Zixibacteria bacterium]
MKKLYILPLLTMLALSALVGCSSNPSSNTEPDVVAIQLNVTSAEQAEAITSYRIVVTGPDMDSVIAPLYRNGQYLEGYVDVPVGLNRRFAVQALDENGEVVLEGVTIMSVSIGVQLQITIAVYPSVPSIRLLPSESTVSSGSTLYLQVRVDQLPGLFGLAGRIYWDGSFVEVDSAYLSSTNTDLLLFWTSVPEEGYFAFSVSNEGTDAMTPIVDDSGDGNLVTLVLSTYASDPEVDTALLAIAPTAVTWVEGATEIPLEEIATDTAMVIVDRTLPETVVFPDPALEAAVRQTIGKTTGTLYVTDVNGVQALVANIQGIQDLTGIEYMAGLRVLSLVGNEITSIEPLDALDSLNTLLIGVNEISDLSPLSNSFSLMALEANGCNIIDLSPISKLSNLTAIVFSDNQIRNVSPLASLSGLQYVDLDDNQINDISALSSLVNISSLELVNNLINDLSPLLESMGSGDELYVTGNPLSTASTDEIIPALEALGVTVEY